MSKFRKGKKKKLQEIATSSLPDIVFMLLFFFMVTTTMREKVLQVEINSVAANQIKKLEDKSVVSYIYIGEPVNKKVFGNLPRIQLNDAFAEPSQISDFIASKRELIDEYKREKMIISLKIDKHVKMGIVTDVKQELRKANALKINYSAYEGDPVKNLDR